MFNQSSVLNLRVFAQLLPVAAANRFSNDRVKGRESDVEDEEGEAGRKRRGKRNRLNMSQNGISAARLGEAPHVLESQT